ncbi:MAG: hypothetical protein OZ928_01295 [Polyangiaceae bacterium]|nr:hypothetical protein [Polyangiaceae bacterium]
MSPRRRPRAARSLVAVLGGLALLTAAGCKKGDAAKCEQATATIRQALQSGDVASARTWREYAYKQCDDGSQLSALDQEIVAKEGELQKAKAAADATKTQSNQLIGLFVGWAADHKGSLDTAGNTVSCDPEEKSATPAPAGEKPRRWCTRTRAASSFTLTARYRDEQRAAVRFSTVAPAPVTCDALGPNRVLGTPVGRSYCEITGGRLQGMQALISARPDGTHVDVFSPEYLAKDPSLAAYTK